MTRLIDADKLRAEYQAILDRGDMFCEYDIIGMVDNAPTVTDVIPNEEGYEMYSKGYTLGKEKGKNERPKGKWIVARQDCHGIHEIECPFCKYNKGRDFSAFIQVTFDIFPPFCEKCGAKLEKEGEEK